LLRGGLDLLPVFCRASKRRSGEQIGEPASGVYNSTPPESSPRRIPAIRSAASRSIGGRTCWYRSLVIAVEACPRALLQQPWPRPSRQTVAMRPHNSHPALTRSSPFARFYFPSDVIVLAVRWYLRFALSYRDIEELLSERGIEVDHTTIYRWVQRFTPLLADAPDPAATPSGPAGRSTRPT
jgi:hypothetical protein